jgi:hypothetical protein
MTASAKAVREIQSTAKRAGEIQTLSVFMAPFLSLGTLF